MTPGFDLVESQYRHSVKYRNLESRSSIVLDAVSSSIIHGRTQNTRLSWPAREEDHLANPTRNRGRAAKHVNEGTSDAMKPILNGIVAFLASLDEDADL